MQMGLLGQAGLGRQTCAGLHSSAQPGLDRAQPCGDLSPQVLFPGERLCASLQGTAG